MGRLVCASAELDRPQLLVDSCDVIAVPDSRGLRIMGDFHNLSVFSQGVFNLSYRVWTLQRFIDRIT